MRLLDLYVVFLDSGCSSSVRGVAPSILCMSGDSQDGYT